MIVELPSEQDFLWEGLDLLNLAWDSVLRLLRNWEDAEDSGLTSLDDISGKYWKAAARQLSTGLALAQQGVEFRIKALICGVNPLLLLAMPVRDWPARAAHEDVPFADFKTVDALDLPKLHDSVISPPLPAEFVKQYSNLRRQRNALLHTIDKRLSISAHEVIVAVLEASHHLFAPRSWMKLRSASLEESPESVAFSPDFVEGLVIREALLALAALDSSESRKYFGFDKKKRTYICPNCTPAYQHFAEKEARSAQLEGVGAKAKTVWCFICEKITVVIRRACVQASCPGNVISDEDDTCLTCGHSQEPHRETA